MLSPAGNKIVNKGIKFPLIILILITVNVIGILLKFFGLYTYFTLFGFRFQISLFLPVLILLREERKDFFINIFRNPSYKKNLIFIYLLIVPVLILFVILFILKKVSVGDPEHFYEFGISSIIDFPVYLIWNSPQLALFFLFLILTVSASKFKFLLVAFIFIILFAYELIPFSKESFDYFHLASLILFASIAGS